MTHDELLAICDNYSFKDSAEPVKVLRAVVELHKPLPIVNGDGAANCSWCQIAGIRETPYPCETIRAIEKELT